MLPVLTGYPIGSSKADTENPLVFVSVERRIGQICGRRVGRGREEPASSEDETSIKEVRNLVFHEEFPTRRPCKAAAHTEAGAPGEEDFTHLVRSGRAKFLFRYSALTFNAHAIHLDPDYCKKRGEAQGSSVPRAYALPSSCTLLRLHLIKGAGSLVSGYDAT